jgi:hypothetical protein
MFCLCNLPDATTLMAQDLVNAWRYSEQYVEEIDRVIARQEEK